MRILFCTANYFPSAAGGAEQQARLQAEGLVAKGHYVEVVCPRYPGMAGGRVGGVYVHRLPALNRRYLRTATYMLMLGLFLVLRLRRFDLVHVHIAALQADVAVGAALFLRKPTYVKVACGGDVGEVSRMRTVAPIVRYFGLRHATRVQALSREIEHELRGIGVAPSRIVHIPNGLDLDAFTPATAERRRELRAKLGLPPDATIVLFVGRFARYKGVLDLLDAWREPPVDDSVLVLVGSAETDAAVGPLPVLPRVIVHSWTNSVRDYYDAADVLALPSHADGMSNAMLEGMASGLAVIASNVASHEGVVTDGVDGILVPPGDVLQLRAAIHRLAADAELRRRLGARARESVARLSIETVVEAIEQQYELIRNGG